MPQIVALMAAVRKEQTWSASVSGKGYMGCPLRSVRGHVEPLGGWVEEGQSSDQHCLELEPLCTIYK